MQQGPGGRHRGPAASCPELRSVAGLLGAATIGGAAAVGRPATLGGTPGGRELAALARGQAAAFCPLLELDLRRLLDRGEEPADGPAGAADLVHPLGHRSAAVGQRAVPVLVDRTQRLVHLDELAVGETPDDAGLDAVL